MSTLSDLVQKKRAGVRCCFDDHPPAMLKDRVVLIVIVTADLKRSSFGHLAGKDAGQEMADFLPHKAKLQDEKIGVR